MKKTVLLWLVAFIITGFAAVYQRITGPTYPKKETISFNNQQYKFKLIRSAETGSDADIKIEISDTSIKAIANYRRYPTNEEWKTIEFKREGNFLICSLPQQPAAGKLEYFISFNQNEKTTYVEKDSPVVIRFKGVVPSWILIPHIFFIFFAMFLSNLTGMMAAFKHEKKRLFGLITLGFIIVGGMICGPIVQKYAFGEFWTGVPFGWDLTDNKTLIGFIAWIIAILGNWKKDRNYLYIVAAVVMFIVFMIPHSLFGSQLDPNSGKVIQGMIQIFF